ncbi:MAG TPA: hypothetical protein VJ841_02560 [Candidatus Saccharimonadales bacterium]|nr:hypothetical protein [Candidatus Saccharimonadales bacterium]
MATKASSKHTVAKPRKTKNAKVDFEPNKMALAVASLSAVILMLLALIAALN